MFVAENTITKYYFECHITIKPVFGLSRNSGMY